MFTCKACLKSAVDTFHGPALPNSLATCRNILQPLRTTTKASRPTRRYTTAVATRKSSNTTDSKDSTSALQTTKHDDDQRIPKVGRSADWAARKELDYLKDPLHIANRVRKALDKDDFEHAALITRKASKDTAVAVSWNHLIDYQLKRNNIHGALKLYNEVSRLFCQGLKHNTN
jgi:pentatricopeptide repeat protein